MIYGFLISFKLEQGQIGQRFFFLFVCKQSLKLIEIRADPSVTKFQANRTLKFPIIFTLKAFIPIYD